MKKRYLRKVMSIVIAASVAFAHFRPSTAAAADPDAASAAGAIVITPSKGGLYKLLADSVAVTFPTPMIEPESEVKGGQPCPIVFEPPIDVSWIWVSQTEGKILPPVDYTPDGQGRLIRRIMYRAKLRDGLRDLAGNLVDPQNWGAEFADDQFALNGVEYLNAFRPPKDQEADAEEESEAEPPGESLEDTGIEGRGAGDTLPARPRVRLEFSRNVTLQEVAKIVHFRDSQTHERFPVEVNIEGIQPSAPQGWVIVEPIDPLPAGRSYILVIERLASADSKETLPLQRIVPAGTTFPVRINVVAGFNQPVEGAFIRIRASKPIDPDAQNLKLISVEPLVPNLRMERHVRNGRTIDLQGDFDTAAVYTVTIKAGLKSLDQFSLPGNSVWKARFGKKRAAIIMPEPLVFQRASSPAVRCSFMQVNTGPLEWKIASIAPADFAKIRGRLREFGDFALDEQKQKLVDARTGEYLHQPTELLIPAMGLPVLASGSVEASGDDLEITRQLEWRPGDNKPGLYLLEISGKDLAGRTVGNRSIISRSDWVITQVKSAYDFVVRVASMTDGKPVRGIPVQILMKDGNSAGPVSTDANGEARFEPAQAGNDEQPMIAILAGAPGRQFLQLPDLPDFEPGGVSQRIRAEELKERGVIVTDRNLYRPGETVKFKGFVRLAAGERLSIPAGKPLKWEVTTGGEPVFEGEAVISDAGAWEGEWQIPGSALGNFYIQGPGGSARFGVAEFRPLPFSVSVEAADVQGDSVSAKVSSIHFHGAPNADAKVRWKAEWIADDWGSDDAIERDWSGLSIDDRHSPDSPARGVSGDVLGRLAKAGWDVTHGTRGDLEMSVSETRRGETTLDANGLAAIECKSPFRPGLHRRANVYWTVDVISPSAQTLRAGGMARVQFVPQILGVRLDSRPGRELILTVNSINSRNELASGLAAKAEVFSLNVKTVKERLAPNIHRYRNFPIFEKVWEGEVVTPVEVTIPVRHAGFYVVRVTAPAQPNTPQVSAAATVPGDERVDVPVENETSLSIEPDRERYRAGDVATFSVEAPFTGAATVIVAADRLLARRVVELKGNAQRFSLPVLTSFSPNAYVCIHLIKAAGPDGIPAERFGSCEIKVDRADRLDVTTELKRDTVEPGAEASGIVRVRSGGKPVPGADVLLFAVDDAVLTLGRWEMPDMAGAFFPERSLGLVTSAALGNYWTPGEADVLSHAQKGFVLGDGEAEPEVLPFRKYFKALAFWQPSAKTNAAGEIPFQFKAPDSLTRYRVVAVAQNGVEQFGTGQSMLRLAKSIQVEPALPAFLRRDDEVVLRTLVRQDYADSDEIDVSIERLGSAIALSEPGIKRVTVRRGQPAVIGFRARVVPGPNFARVLFAARSASRASMRDGEDNTLRIYPAGIERRETVAGSLATTQGLDLKAAVRPYWQQGVCDVLLSGSPYLPKLAGLPAMLEAEGSIEKLSTRVLAATLLAETLEYLPLAPEADKKLRARIDEDLRLFARSYRIDRKLPLWPSQVEPNDFVTIQAAWAIFKAESAGFGPSPHLVGSANAALRSIVEGWGDSAKSSPSNRCFALMVLGRDSAETANEDLVAVAEELFDGRDQLSDEGRAWLALGMHYYDILPDERDALLREIDRPAPSIAFDPATFTSQTREEAIRLLAQSEIASTNWSAAQRESARQLFDRITQSSVDLSTQENLWLLILFNSLTRGEISPELGRRPLDPKPSALSKNNISAGWLGVPLSKVPETFPRPLRPGVRASYLIRASYQATASGLPQDVSFHLERTVRNLTDPARTGAPEAPFKLGDQILTTYRLNADKPHSYVEVEDQLPACLETVNPKLPLIAEHFHLPIEAGVNTLPLSHVEQRSERTVLYFEKTLPGRNVYSVLARVTTPGVFSWPATQMRPMYDSRFSGVSGPMIVCAVE